MKLVVALMALLAWPACAARPIAAPPAPDRPRILGIAHMALYVSDLAKARAFYRDFLGFDGPFSLKRDDGRDRIAFIKVNDQQYIELFEEPPGRDGRLNHIALQTSDAEGLQRALAARRVRLSGPVRQGKIGNSQFGVTDPDGHNVEITEYEPGGWTVRDRGKFLPDTRVAARILHLGVLVGALEPSLAFYRGVLGFEETWRGGPSPAQLSWVNLRVPDGDDYLELMLYDQLPPPDQRGVKNHICLEVTDLAAAVARLEARPARQSYQRAIEMKVGVNRKRQANLFDPDGTRVELMEPHTVDGQPAPSSTAPPPRPR
jgi:catechol 2,3-dioxygenase-like lactoylglutathione lyase family enzyme